MSFPFFHLRQNQRKYAQKGHKDSKIRTKHLPNKHLLTDTLKETLVKTDLMIYVFPATFYICTRLISAWFLCGIKMPNSPRALSEWWQHHWLPGVSLNGWWPFCSCLANEKHFFKEINNKYNNLKVQNYESVKIISHRRVRMQFL